MNACHMLKKCAVGKLEMQGGETGLLGWLKMTGVLSRWELFFSLVKGFSNKLFDVLKAGTKSPVVYGAGEGLPL